MRFIVEQRRSASDMFDFRENGLPMYWCDAPDAGGYTFDRHEATVYDLPHKFSEQDKIELMGGYATVIPVSDLEFFNRG